MCIYPVYAYICIIMYVYINVYIHIYVCCDKKQWWWQSGSTEAYSVEALCAWSSLFHALASLQHTSKTVLRINIFVYIYIHMCISNIYIYMYI